MFLNLTWQPVKRPDHLSPREDYIYVKSCPRETALASIYNVVGSLTFKGNCDQKSIRAAVATALVHQTKPAAND